LWLIEFSPKKPLNTFWQPLSDVLREECGRFQAKRSIGMQGLLHAGASRLQGIISAGAQENVTIGWTAIKMSSPDKIQISRRSRKHSRQIAHKVINGICG